MTWTPTHSEPLLLVRRLLPFFCLAISPVAAEALTQNEVYDAVFLALFDWGTAGQSYNQDVVNTYPVDLNNASLGEYLGPNGDSSSPYLLSILQFLPLLSPSNQLADVLEYLDSIDKSTAPLWQSTYESNGNGDPALLVHDVDLYDEVVDQGYTLSSIDQHVLDLQAVLESLHLGDVGSNVSNIVELLDPSGTESLPDESDVDLPEGDDELEELLVTPPSTTWTQVDYDLSVSSGSPVIVLWEDMELAGFSLPDGKIDLSTGQMARGVSVMGRISRTLWWLAYYTGLFLLLRREYVYYTSLGSSEGAA